MMAIPEIVRFLGLQIDERIASDLKYSIEMLSSKDPKSFFSGLKILAAIHESNEESAKRVLAEKILTMLCKVIPSYVKRGPEFYELNKTKIEESIKSGKHPLDLKNTLALAKRGSVPAGAIEEKPTGFVMSATTPSSPAERSSSEEVVEDDGGDIKVISIEDIATGEEELVAMAKLDAAQTSTQEGAGDQITATSTTHEEDIEPTSPGESLDFQPPEDNSFEDDEWVSAGLLNDVADSKVLFDKDGKVTNDLTSGLNLINPVEREREIDLNYSSARGYHDPYTASAIPGKVTPDMFVEPEMSDLPAQNESNSYSVDIVDASTMIGQPCGFGDGEISSSDGKVYVCPYCKAIFHDGCGKLVLEVEGGRCPACNAAWN